MLTLRRPGPVGQPQSAHAAHAQERGMSINTAFSRELLKQVLDEGPPIVNRRMIGSRSNSLMPRSTESARTIGNSTLVSSIGTAAPTVRLRPALKVGPRGWPRRMETAQALRGKASPGADAQRHNAD